MSVINIKKTETQIFLEELGAEKSPQDVYDYVATYGMHRIDLEEVINDAVREATEELNNQITYLENELEDKDFKIDNLEGVEQERDSAQQIAEQVEEFLPSNLHDEMINKVFTNLKRNLSLSEIEAIEEGVKKSFILKNKTYKDF